MADLQMALESELTDAIWKMNSLEVGTEEYCKAATAVSTLMKEVRAVDELRLKETEVQEQKKASKHQLGLGIAGIAVPSLLTIWGTLTTIRFEEESNMSSTAGKYFFGRQLKGGK